MIATRLTLLLQVSHLSFLFYERAARLLCWALGGSVSSTEEQCFLWNRYLRLILTLTGLWPCMLHLAD